MNLKAGWGLKGFPRTWESIDDFTDRLMVHGGWIVRSQVLKECRDGVGFSLSTTYVPDPKWYWKLEPKENNENT